MSIQKLLLAALIMTAGLSQSWAIGSAYREPTDEKSIQAIEKVFHAKPEASYHTNGTKAVVERQLITYATKERWEPVNAQQSVGRYGWDYFPNRNLVIRDGKLMIRHRPEVLQRVKTTTTKKWRRRMTWGGFIGGFTLGTAGGMIGFLGPSKIWGFSAKTAIGTIPAVLVCALAGIAIGTPIGDAIERRIKRGR